jgi:hypothetical protein
MTNIIYLTGGGMKIKRRRVDIASLDTFARDKDSNVGLEGNLKQLLTW